MNGVELMATQSTSLQAFKQPDAGLEATSQGLKPQAWVNKLQDPGTGIESTVPKLQGTSNQDKSIFFMLNMKRNLVRREPHKIGFFGRSYF